LREEYRLKVFERDEVTGEWKRVHMEELFALHSSSNIIKVFKLRTMRWAGHVAHEGKDECIQGFGGKTLGKGTT
jgi:hypothetical protein